MAIDQICEEPPRVEVKAMKRESGDQVGEASVTRGALVRRRTDEPSSAASQRLVVFLLAASSQVLRVKAAQSPSGEGIGSPSRSIATMSCTEKGWVSATAGEETASESEAAIPAAAAAARFSREMTGRMGMDSSGWSDGGASGRESNTPPMGRPRPGARQMRHILTPDGLRRGREGPIFQVD